MLMTINVGVNFADYLNDTEKKIIELIISDPTITAQKISININKTKRTVERNIKSLQEKGYIQRNGSHKKSYWRVIK